MVSSLNVCDELQDLYVNCLMSYFIKGGFFFTDSFHCIVPVAIKVFSTCFSVCCLPPVVSLLAFLSCAVVEMREVLVSALVL